MKWLFGFFTVLFFGILLSGSNSTVSIIGFLVCLATASILSELSKLAEQTEEIRVKLQDYAEPICSIRDKTNSIYGRQLLDFRQKPSQD